MKNATLIAIGVFILKASAWIYLVMSPVLVVLGIIAASHSPAEGAILIFYGAAMLPMATVIHKIARMIEKSND